MIKLKDLIHEKVNEIKNGRVGDYFTQKAGSDTVNYGVIVDELANGAFKVVMFSVRNGKMTGSAKVSSTKGWYPEPKKISKEEIPDKVLSKIEKKSKKYESVNEAIEDFERGDRVHVKKDNKSGVVVKQYGRKVHVKFADGTEKTYTHDELMNLKDESVNESKYKGNVLADVIEDIIKDENFKNVKRVEDSQTNNSLYIYLDTRDKNVASNIMKTLKSKYNVNDVKYSESESAIVVPSGTLMESTYSETYFDTFTAAVQHAKYVAEKQGYVVDDDDWFKQVGTGGRYTRSRPSIGKTHRFSVDLFKNGKKARKSLQIQVYGMESGGYELNTYIN